MFCFSLSPFRQISSAQYIGGSENCGTGPVWSALSQHPLRLSNLSSCIPFIYRNQSQATYFSRRFCFSFVSCCPKDTAGMYHPIFFPPDWAPFLLLLKAVSQVPWLEALWSPLTHPFPLYPPRHQASESVTLMTVLTGLSASSPASFHTSLHTALKWPPLNINFTMSWLCS